MAIKRQKFASQVDPAILSEAHRIAESEGRQFQSVLEEALTDLIEKKRTDKPRAHVMARYQASTARFDELYKRLAK